MRDLIAGSLESLSIGAAIVGTLLPPWNLFWWGLGWLGIVLLGRPGPNKDPSGDLALAAFALPGIALAWPFHALSNLVREKA